MKRLFTVIILTAITAVSTNSLKAQDLQQFFDQSEQDGVNYLGEYFRPAIISASNGMANGWNNTAKPHKLFGFDATMTVSVAGIPDTDYNFLFKNADYSSIRLVGSQTEAELPTLAGGTANQQLEVYDPETGITIPGSEFTPPPGAGFDQVPVIKPGFPIVLANIGIGLPKNTELRVRFSPISNIGEDISIAGSFGVGVLHDIKQWIPGMKLVPIDIAAFVGYNRYNFNYSDGEQNEVSFTSSATTVNILASKKLLFFTPYVGLGFNAISSNFSFSSVDAGIENAEFEYDNLGGARATIGARLKILWVLALNVDYSFQRYNTLNVGLGVNFR